MLDQEALAFAARLNALAEKVFDQPPSFAVNVVSDGGQAIIGAAPFTDNQPADYPLIRQNDDPAHAALFLRVRFTVEMDRTDEYLQVSTSSVGLFVDVTAGRKRAKAVVRVEYDRYPAKPDRASAHVQLHAHSPELAWCYGSSGAPAPDLHALHFPVGGRRFRPTLEEFLLFLDRENLFTNWRTGWKSHVLESMKEWESRQAAATARRFPSEAAAELRKQRYIVIEPA